MGNTQDRFRNNMFYLRHVETQKVVTSSLSLSSELLCSVQQYFMLTKLSEETKNPSKLQLKARSQGIYLGCYKIESVINTGPFLYPFEFDLVQLPAGGYMLVAKDGYLAVQDWLIWSPFYSDNCKWDFIEVYPRQGLKDLSRIVQEFGEIMGSRQVFDHEKCQRGYGFRRSEFYTHLATGTWSWTSTNVKKLRDLYKNFNNHLGEGNNEANLIAFSHSANFDGWDNPMFGSIKKGLSFSVQNLVVGDSSSLTPQESTVTLASQEWTFPLDYSGKKTLEIGQLIGESETKTKTITGFSSSTEKLSINNINNNHTVKAGYSSGSLPGLNSAWSSSIQQSISKSIGEKYSNKSQQNQEEVRTHTQTWNIPINNTYELNYQKGSPNNFLAKIEMLQCELKDVPFTAELKIHKDDHVIFVYDKEVWNLSKTQRGKIMAYPIRAMLEILRVPGIKMDRDGGVILEYAGATNGTISLSSKMKITSHF